MFGDLSVGTPTGNNLMEFSHQAGSSLYTQQQPLYCACAVAIFFFNENLVLDTDITVQEVQGALKSLKFGKSVGCDNLDP